MKGVRKNATAALLASPSQFAPMLLRTLRKRPSSRLLRDRQMNGALGSRAALRQTPCGGVADALWPVRDAQAAAVALCADASRTQSLLSNPHRSHSAS